MSNDVVELYPEPPVFNLGKRQRPLAWVAPGERVRFRTTDAGYRVALEQGLGADPQTIHRLNALTGPVNVEDAAPGDALIVEIEGIEVSDQAFVVYVDRWGRQPFGMPSSWIEAFPIENDEIVLDRTSRIPVRPMVGCAGVAPAVNSLSSLSPTMPEGGNMDLRQLETGTQLLLPVAVDGALFALGDLHAAMGTGEPAGAGFECAGSVLVRLGLRKGLPLSGPRLQTKDSISFLGTDSHDLFAAKQRAIEAAWRYLIEDCAVERHRAFAIVSGLLRLEFGGPAGANVLATFQTRELHGVGISVLHA